MIKKLSDKFLSNSFRKNVLMMMSGVVLARAIPFITIPILYRHFNEADFGVLYLFLSSSIMLSSLCTLKYEFAIVLEKNIKDAFNLSMGLIFISMINSSILFLIFFFFKNQIISAFSLQSIAPYIYFIPLSVFFIAFNNVMNYWFNGKSKFNILSGSKIAQPLSSESLKLWNGFHLPNSWGLISGFVIGNIVVTIYYLIYFFNSFKTLFKFIEFEKIKALLKRHKKFPRFNLPSDLLTNVINFSYVALFFKFYDPAVAGNLGLSVSYAYGAFSVISIAYSQVFYKEIATIYDRDKLRNFYWKNAKLLALISVVVVTAVLLIPQQLIILLLGEKGVNLLPILKIMILWIGVSFVSSSLSFIYAKVNAQEKIFYLDIVHFVNVVGGISLVYYLGYGVFTAIWVFALAQIFHYGASILLVNPLIKKWQPEDNI